MSRNYGTRIALALIALVGATLILHAFVKQYRWKRFAVVERGALFRSGQLTANQLSHAIDSFGLKTVVCLNEEAAQSEQRVCEVHDVEFVCLPMPADGLGELDQFAHFLRLASNPESRPLLVHCSAGVARTGAAIALFRMIEQNWSFDMAIAELRSFERRGRCEESLQAHIKLLFEQLCRSDHGFMATHAQSQSVR